jgi:hypothetical protein
MNSLLPMTGTNALLDQLSPFVPDQFLSEQWPPTGTGGPTHCGAPGNRLDVRHGKT